MTGFALVQNGQVVKLVGELPDNFANISGFNNLSNEEVRAHGFLPYIYIQPEYDAFIERLGDVVYTINAESVIGNRQLVALDAETIAEQRARVLTHTSQMLIKILYDTDWTQFASSGLDVEQLAAYNSLRTSVLTARAELVNLTTNAIDALLTVVRANIKDANARLLDFSDELNSLQAALDTIGA